MFRLLSILALLCLSFSNNSFAKSSSEQLQELLQQHKGSVIYVDFWASWCGPCRKSFPWMNEMQSKYDNLKIISIAHIGFTEAKQKAYELELQAFMKE